MEIGFRVESDHMWDFTSGVAVNAFTSFGVPELHVTVVRGGEELCTIIIKGYISDSLRMAIVSTEKFAVVVNIPDL